MVVLFAFKYLDVFIINMVAKNFCSVIDYFILPYYPVPLSVHMRQDEPQAMTFIEVLPVHVDPHINKHRKSESERKRKNKATRNIKKLGNTKQTEHVSSLFIKRA